MQPVTTRVCELALPHGSTLSALRCLTLLMPELLVGRVGCAALAAGTAAAARTSLPLLLLLPLLLFLPLLLLLGCLRPVFSSSCSMSLRFNSRSNLQAHQATGVGCEHKQAAIPTSCDALAFALRCFVGLHFAACCFQNLRLELQLVLCGLAAQSSLLVRLLRLSFGGCLAELYRKSAVLPAHSVAKL